MTIAPVQVSQSVMPQQSFLLPTRPTLDYRSVVEQNAKVGHDIVKYLEHENLVYPARSSEVSGIDVYA